METAKDEEIMILKQRVRELIRENSEMKELILFLDDERNYAKQFVKDFNNKQLKNWNNMKTKLNLLEQKQFELIRENYSLKQVNQFIFFIFHLVYPFHILINQFLRTRTLLFFCFD